MNASNMKTKHNKLYSLQDVYNIKIKIHGKNKDIINKLTKDYRKCENTTILEISNILYNKQLKENELNKINYQISSKCCTSYILELILVCIIVNTIIFGVYIFCV
jgi:hypothetical protein